VKELITNALGLKETDLLNPNTVYGRSKAAGDTYLLFDRLRGLSWENNILGEFRLTTLQQEDLRLVEQLRPQRLSNPDFGETLRHLAECFPLSKTDIG